MEAVEKNLFEVDPQIWTLDDPRVEALAKGEMSQLEFIRLLKQTDPFEVMNGKLNYTTEEAIEHRRKQFIEQNIQNIKNTGGINPRALWENREKLVVVYPELRDKITKIETEIKSENCQGCALGKKIQPFLTDFLALDHSNKDIASLESIIGPNGIKRLKGEEIVVKAEDLPIPDYFRKDKVPKRATALVPVPFKKSTASAKVDAPLSPDKGAAMAFTETPGGDVREACVSCAKKHIAQALVLLKEGLQGYSKAEGHKHVSYAIGHLGEAADEIVALDREMALAIRAVRNSLMSLEG